MKRDVGLDARTQLQQRLRAAIAAGEAPWDHADSWDLPHVLPFNAVTGVPYGGGNAIALLLEQRRRGGDPRWLSLDQAKAAGFAPAPGAPAVPLEFWTRDNGKLRANLVEVYNVADIVDDGGRRYSERHALDRGQLRLDPADRAEQMIEAAGLHIEHVAGHAYPSYDSVTDVIVMPLRNTYEDAAAYHRAVLGQVAVATVMARAEPHPTSPPFVSEAELQLARLFIAIETGVAIDFDTYPSRKYWTRELEDKNFIYRAARDARRTVDYMIGLVPERTLAQEQQLERGLKLIDEPRIALTELTDGQSTFSRRELERYVRARTSDTRQYAALMNAIASSSELIQLDRSGSRFTSRDVFEVERTLVRVGDDLARSDRREADPAIVERVLEGSVLGEQQRMALRHITARGALANVVGYAGTGKSKMLGEARAVWEGDGQRVYGAALSGIAAEGLEEGSGIRSRTIASLLFAWDNDKDRLRSSDVLVVDEAGMLGSRTMARLVTEVEGAGAKLVLVGDPKQLQSIEAGAAFRALIDRHGAARISEIRRQAQEWQRNASIDFAEGRIDQALSAYERHGNVVRTKTIDEAKVELIDRWRQARLAKPEESQIILAYTRKDVNDLNEMARAVMRDAGELGPDQEISTSFGTLLVATGDRLYFRKTDRGLGVKNGSLGTVVSVGENTLGVRLDNGRNVEVDLEEYNSLSRGLAATVHRSQGVTVDRAHFLVTPMVDMNLSYVAMTRQRQSADLYYATDQIRDRRTLVDVLGRDGDKDTSVDYELRAARELAMRELHIRAQEEIALEREGGRLSASEREMRELIAIAHASARNGDEIRPTLAARLADSLGALLDGDKDAATGLLIAENARGNSVANFAELVTWLRDEQVRSGDGLSRDLAESLERIVERRGAQEQTKAVLELETPAVARRAARESLQRDADVGAIPAETKEISVRIVDPKQIADRASRLLTSDNPLEIAAGLLAVTGRRPIEILKTARFERTDDQAPFAVMFSGQAKGIVVKPMEIPTLVDASLVVDALAKVRSQLNFSNVENTIVNRRTARQMGDLVRRHFGDDLVPKDLRNIYLLEAWGRDLPDGGPLLKYAASVLGHEYLDVRTGLSYTQFATDRESALGMLEASRRDLDLSLRNAIAGETDQQMRAYLRERLVELSAARWNITGDVRMHEQRELVRNDRGNVATEQVQQQARLATSERLVVGWYKLEKDEQFPMSRGALLAVRAGDYPIIAERRGGVVDRIGVDFRGEVSQVGQRSDLTLKQERVARRPMTIEQFTQALTAERPVVRIEPYSVTLEGGRVRARDLGDIERVPLAKGTLGVTYDGTHIRVDRESVVQRLAGGELVRHRTAAIADGVALGARVALSYADGQVRTRSRERTQAHELSHQIS